MSTFGVGHKHSRGGECYPPESEQSSYQSIAQKKARIVTSEELSNKIRSLRGRIERLQGMDEDLIKEEIKRLKSRAVDSDFERRVTPVLYTLYVKAQNQHTEAIKYFKKNHVNDAIISLQRALQSLPKGSQSEKPFKSSAYLNKWRTHILYNLGYCFGFRRSPEDLNKAIDCYTQALALTSKFPENFPRERILCHLGNALILREKDFSDIDQAVDSFRAAYVISLNPSLFRDEALCDLTGALILRSRNTSDSEKRKTDLEEVIQLCKTPIQTVSIKQRLFHNWAIALTHRNKPECSDQLSDLDQASGIFQKLLNTQPSISKSLRIDTLYCFAQTLYQKSKVARDQRGCLTLAIGFLKEAIRISDKNSIIYPKIVGELITAFHARNLKCDADRGHAKELFCINANRMSEQDRQKLSALLYPVEFVEE